MSVISSGIVSISSGVTSTGLEVIQTGAIHVLNDGWAESVSAADGGSIVVSKGGILYVCTLAGGTATVLNGGWAESVAVRNGGLYLLNSGASTHDTLISSGGSARVGRDVMATGMTVLEGGVLHVDPAGYARAPVVSTGGAVHVSAAGIVDKARVYGSVFVSSGGSFNSSTVNPDAEVIVAAGGICSKVQVHGGTFSVESGALVRGTVVDSGGQFLLLGTNETGGSSASGSSGGARETTVNSDGTMTVNSGAVADSTTVNAGGRLDVSGGATATDIKENGGYVDVEAGAEVVFTPNTFSDLVLSNASATLHSGTTANSTTVSGGGWLYVSSGGTAGSTTVNIGGSVFVSSGGTANRTTVNSKGFFQVSSGGTATKTTINSWGYFHVSSGGTADDITVNTSGIFAVIGGTVNSTTVYDRGSLNLISGGEANNTTLNLSGYLDVYSGGTASNTLIGGSMHISSGGTANGNTVNDRGRIDILFGGLASNTTVNSRGSMFVRNNASAVAVKENGGYVYVEEGATVSFLPNSIKKLELKNASATVHSGTTLTDTGVGSNSLLIVYSGGSASNITVISGGTFTLENGGSAKSTQLNVGGTFLIESGGTADSTTVKSGVSFYVSNGCTLNNTIVDEYGSLFVLSGGLANGNTIKFSGSLIVSSAGTVDGTTVSRGFMIVSSGGTAVDTTVNRCQMYVENGGIVNNTTIFGDEGNTKNYLNLSSGGTASNTIVDSGGRFYVDRGGSAVGVTVSKFGLLSVETGGIATDVVWTPCQGFIYGPVTFSEQYSGVYYGSNNDLLSHSMEMDDIYLGGGEMYVMSGGTANRITINNTHWYFQIYSGGTANSTTVSMGCVQVYSGGVINHTTVKQRSYGGIMVFAGGIANDTTVGSGGEIWVSSGGTATGKMVFEEGAVVSAFEGAILDFDLTQIEAGAEEALVNDLSIIKGTPKYSLTVDADSWKPGSCVYSLAKGAENFASTITVVDKMSGDELGVLTVGETVSIGDHDFTLNLNDSTLSVTILTPIPAPENLIGTKDRVSWDPIEAEQYVIVYSTDHFEHVIQATASTTAIDMLALPAGTYQWRVRVDDDYSDWAVGEDIVSDNRSDTPKVLVSNEDGCGDLFFASANGTWDITYFAMNVGSINDWEGTKEIISARGRNRIQNLYFGSSDPNVLCLTDGENGDAIFVDDVYTELPDEIEENMARLYRIQEIRAGAGDDIVDMTSQQFEYTGDGLTIRGGDGDDVIWANKGDNWLFGDAGNDRIVGASGNDVIAGGIGNDRMHGGGGSDVFTFCENWGMDTVEQLGTGTVTLWFAESESRITASELDGNSVFTNADGTASVTVNGFALADIMVKYGDDGSDDYAALASAGAFFDATTERIFEESGKGILASL